MSDTESPTLGQYPTGHPKERVERRGTPGQTTVAVIEKRHLFGAVQRRMRDVNKTSVGRGGAKRESEPQLGTAAPVSLEPVVAGQQQELSPQLRTDSDLMVSLHGTHVIALPPRPRTGDGAAEVQAHASRQEQTADAHDFRLWDGRARSRQSTLTGP